MPSEPQIKLLPYKSRQRFFLVLLVVFVIALPVIIFYTTGYRITIDENGRSIVTTGGVYVTTDNLDVDVYVDDEHVEKPRLFRSAYYIQNVDAGQHRIVVQKPDFTTWVKELPVDPYIVIEAAAFNMPKTPHLRPISEFLTDTGMAVYFEKNPGTSIFTNATATEPYLILTKLGTTTVEKNEEYNFVASLFSTSTATSSGVFSRILREVERFGFSTTTSDGATTTAFVEKGSMRLVEDENELKAVWVGSSNTIPYYFCVTDTIASTTALRYGEHVMKQVWEQKLSTSSPLVSSGNYLCRTSIQIDRKRQNVYYYDFFPNSVDLVVLQLDEGLFVTEIDDRAWQNTQLLYPGHDFKTLVHNDVIYIEKDGRYFELVTEIEE